jgi:hypothetical protein
MHVLINNLPLSRKSSLQDRLSAGEIRKLTEKLRRKRILNSDRNTSAGSKEQSRYMIDYERFAA